MCVPRGWAEVVPIFNRQHCEMRTLLHHDKVASAHLQVDAHVDKRQVSPLKAVYYLVSILLVTSGIRQTLQS